MQNIGGDGEAGKSEKKYTRVDAGQSMEAGIRARKKTRPVVRDK